MLTHIGGKLQALKLRLMTKLRPYPVVDYHHKTSHVNLKRGQPNGIKEGKSVCWNVMNKE